MWKERDEIVAEFSTGDTNLERHDDIQIDEDFRLELYKKGKQRMIAQELKEQMKKRTGDRDNEWDNLVHMEKICCEALEREKE